MAGQFSVTGKISNRKLRRHLNRIENYLNTRFPREVLKDFKQHTPKQSGNARNSTILKRTTQGWQIQGNYAYSGVLDQGLYPNPPKTVTGKTRNGYSTQAPAGMVEPTLKDATKRFKAYIRRLT